MRAGSSSSRISDSAVTLLPEPDSPTMPSVSPAATEKLTPSTARDDAVVGEEMRAQIAHVDHRAGKAGAASL